MLLNVTTLSSRGEWINDLRRSAVLVGRDRAFLARTAFGVTMQ